MAVSKQKNNNFNTWGIHFVTAISTVGITSWIIWLATGMSIASLLNQAFIFGAYAGVGLLFAAISALAITPFALSAIYLSVTGLLLGAGAVGLTIGIRKLIQGNNNSMGVSEQNGQSEDELNSLDEESNESTKQDNLNLKQQSSQMKKADSDGRNEVWKKLGSIGLNTFISSGLTILMSFFAPNVLVALAIVPTFLAGLALGLFVTPFFAAVEFMGPLTLPFISGAFLIGTLATSFTAYFMSNDHTEHLSTGSVQDFSVIEEESKTQKDSPSKMMQKLNQGKLGVEETQTQVELNRHEGHSSPLFDKKVIKKEFGKPIKDISDSVSCCGFNA